MEIIIYIWGLSAAYLVLHYVFFHGRLIFHKADQSRFAGGVSVIICAQNEEDNLRKNLPKVLSQVYENFEVLVVNDHSNDNSGEVLQRLVPGHSHLRIVNFDGPKVGRGKKQALMLGIEHARYEHLLFTDADCRPVSENWLAAIVAHFQNKEIVLGISPYRFEKNIAGWLTRWETFLTSQQYLSFAKAGMPYMGVGRNLAYTKSIFEASSKMKNHLNLPSGDDDLLIGEVANSNNVAIEFHPQASTISDAPDTFGQWWKQKRRHLSTSYHYKKGPAFFLAMFGFAQVLFYVGLLPAFFFWGHTMIFLILFGVKILLQIATMVPFAVRSGQNRAMAMFIIIEPIVVLLQVAIHFQNKILGNSKEW